MVLRTIAHAAMLLALALLVLGCSSDDSSEDDAAPAATSTTATTTSAEPLPTSETVKLAIFERAYSECASTEFVLLANKYKVAQKTRPNVATAVAVAWTKYFKGGKDAIAEGRAGCKLAFDEEQEQ